MKKQMKKTIATIALVAIAMSVIGLSLFAKAAEVEINNTVMLNEAIDDDLYVLGGTVGVIADVNGDVIVLGGEVEIEGNVEGDLFVGGGNVTVNGDVADDIRAIGGSMLVNGNVGDDLIIAGGTVSFASNSVVEGDIYGLAGNANLRGTVSGNVTVIASIVSFSGEILGDAKFTAQDSLSIYEGSQIHGDLTYRFKKEVDVPSGVVLGEVSFNEVPEIIEEEEEEEEVVEEVAPVEAPSGIVITRGTVLMRIWSYVSLIVIGLVFLLLVPYSCREVSGLVKQHYGKTLFYGLMFIAGMPAVAIMLMFTVVGFKLAVLMLLVLAFAWPIAKIFASYFIGSLILRHKTKTTHFWKEFGRLALGLLILLVVSAIPYVGTLVYWIAIFIGLGGVVMYGLRILKDLKRKKAV